MLKKEAHSEEQYFETSEAMSKSRLGLEEVISGSRNTGRDRIWVGFIMVPYSQEQFICGKNKRQP